MSHKPSVERACLVKWAGLRFQTLCDPGGTKQTKLGCDHRIHKSDNRAVTDGAEQLAIHVKRLQ